MRDAWNEADPVLCEVCGRETCEEHAPAAALNGHDRDDVAAREARYAIAVQQELQRERVKREARRQLDAEARGPIIPPDLRTLRERLARPRPAQRWRIDGWQPADSRVILAAPRKAGKTTIMGSLVRSLVDGDPWLGVAPVQPVDGAVVLLDVEMSEWQADEWLAAQRIARDDRIIVESMRRRAGLLDLLDPELRAAWAEWLRARHTRYLIIDCLRPILDAIGLDESREAGRWLVQLDALLQAADIPDALVVHHMGHAGLLGGTERSRGDSRIRDWPDVEWQLLRQDDADDRSPRFIKAYGRDVDQPESQLAYDAYSRRLTLTGGSRTAARTAQALDAVIQAIETAGAPLSGRQIEACLGDGPHPRKAVRSALEAGRHERRLLTHDGPRGAVLYRLPSMPPAGTQEDV